MSERLLHLSAIVKDYHNLRPLRIDDLALDRGGHVAILGLDRPAAEVLVNLVTGATLPDTGTVNLFGRSSAAIADGTEWLAIVDRFGIVSARAVLLDSLSVAQNLAMPFSLDIEPLVGELRGRAIGAGREVGLEDAHWDRAAAELPPAARVRLRLARALALDPAIVLLEHPTADVARDEVVSLGGEIRAILERRGVAALTLTADPEFASAVAETVLALDPATGRLAPRRRRWFGRRST